MRDKDFREVQEARMFAPHVAPINNLVDELRAERAHGWVPYVAPQYGGIHASLLSIFRDPGPKARASGFLCLENDDASAERAFNLMKDAGITPADATPWNIYPWYINRAPTAVQLEDGVEPMRRILALLPYLTVIMLHGRSAQDGWRRLLRRHSTLVSSNITVIPTYHTSRQAFWTPDPEERERRAMHQVDAFRKASKIIGAGRSSS